MEVEFYCEDCDLSLKHEDEIIKWIEETVDNEGKEADVVTVIFCSDKYLLDMNIKFLNHNYYTDIITFDYTENNIISGDLFISIDTVGKNSFDYKVRFINELYRVIIHGVLHLLGYKDKTEQEAKEMRSKEDFYLERLKLSK